MSEYYHVVPWYNSDEWHKVYSEIYSRTSTLANKQEALKLLLIWKARCPSLPAGIESTLTLLEVHVQDMSSSSDLVKEQLLRLAYSSAIMRFVNHMLDTETAKGTSLYQAAKNLSIPDWIIDLRHDTAHSNNLPSIQLLREAALISIDWLQKHYWDKYKEIIRDYRSGQKETDNSDEYKISALMSFCISLSVCANSKTKIRNLADIPDADMRESIVNDASELFGNYVDFSNPKKVSVKALIDMMNIHAKKILKANNTSKHVNKALLGEDSLFLSLELLNHIVGPEYVKNKLNWQYKQCFEVLLTFLHSNDLLLEFILELIRITQCDENEDTRPHLAAVWVSEVLKALRRTKNFIIKVSQLNCSDTGVKNRNELKQLFEHWFPNEKGTGLLFDLQKPVPEELMSINFIQPIISTYNPYLTYFIKDLLNLVEPPLPKNTSEKICNLAKLISSSEKFSETSTRIYTLDDVKMANDMYCSAEEEPDDSDCFEVSTEMVVEHITVEKRTESGVWQLASSDYGWATCPVGVLPWQVNRKQVTQMES